MQNENPTPQVAENDQVATGSTPTSAENGSTEPRTLTGSYQKQPESTPEPTSEPKPENPNLEYPKGFDAETYDLATKQVKMDKVLERMEQSNAETEKYKKQSQDFRKIISKGQAKEAVEDYVEGYVAPENMKNFYNFEEEQNPEFKQGLDMLAKHAVDNGLNQEQFTSNVNMFNDLMTDLGIIDTRTPEQRAIEQEDWLRAEKAKIDPDPVKAERMIKQTVDMFSNANIFSEDEKNAVLSQLDSNAELISAMNKVARYISKPTDGIPTTEVVTSGMPSIQALDEELANPATTQTRRVEIAQMKVKMKNR